MTLVVLAAGMGSRYGGLKQIDPMTDNGEFIIDFSVFDAIKSGFDKVVFVIKEENLELFRESVGKRFEDKIEVKYVFQRLDDLPEGFSVPEGRVKPWGTAHAMLAARHEVKDCFSVINADDFYGESAYRMVAEHFKNTENNSAKKCCMVGYTLSNTLTEHGTVARGICNVSENGYLLDVEERTKIERRGDIAVSVENGVEYTMPLDSVVSMNFWGFTPDIFEGVKKGFVKFLSEHHEDELKCEFYLPFAVADLMRTDGYSVKVYRSDDAWYGVTYAGDKERVKQSITA
ncbi:MAG: hypothetical protein J6Q77_00265, partial [Clostridia bacterium]|nr:hypothetical protein [Clostridia bacterium]